MNSMRKQAMGWLAVGVLGAAAHVGLVARAERTSAGPPMICQPLDIGDARTIPEPSARTSRSALVTDTLAALRSARSVLVRMETLRRATLGMARDDQGSRAAFDLLARLSWSAMDAEAGNRKGEAALAYFDAAYLAACYEQMGLDSVGKVGQADGVSGYLWARHALSLAGDSPEMEFGAALIVHPAMHRGTDQAYRKHLDRAAEGATSGSLLEKNLNAHREMWKDFAGR
jgi:hypothetical protein